MNLGDGFNLTQEPWVLQWVAERIREPSRFTKQATAMAVVRGGDLKAAAVYDFYKPAYQSMAIAIAGTQGWATPSAVKIILAAPFKMLNVNRLQCIVHKKNKRSRKLVEGVGFTLEGVMKDFWGPDNGDACTYRLLRNEWETGRFSNGK
jgi:hypothetical protein